MKLVEYPTSTPAEFVITITYRECYPYDFSGPIIEDITMKVDDTGPEIDFFFDQYPCSWNQTYEITITTKDGES